MKTIQIKTKAFFDLLKMRETSMWSMFAEMINKDEEQLIVFLDEQNKEVARYILPTNEEQLQKDQKTFSEEFKKKLSNSK